MNAIVSRVLLTTLLAVLGGCGKGVMTEAVKAEWDGRIINNEVMGQTYPSTFKRSNPPYLERDFEAGADFICNEIKLKRGKDICSDPDINWR